MRASLDAHLAAQHRAAPDAPQLRELLAAPGLVELRSRLRLDLADDVPAPAGPDASGDDAPVVLSLATLRRFLETPVQAWAQVVLRLDEVGDDEDGTDREDEPFDPEALHRASLLRESFAAALTRGGALDEEYARARRRRELSGHMPRGLFGEVAAGRDLERLHTWWRELWTRKATLGPWTRLAFGRAGVRDAELLPAIALDVPVRGRVRRIELVGTTELLGGDARERSLVLVQGNLRDDHRLRHAVDHLALAAAGAATGPREGFVLADKPDVRRLGAWTPDAARAHLAVLIGDLLGGPHDYYLPLKAACDVLKSGDGRVPKKPRGSGTTEPVLGFGPIQRDPGLPPPVDALAIATRRIAPILDRMAKEDAS